MDTQMERREFVRRVIALDPMIDQTLGELSHVRYHSVTLQTAVHGLFMALDGWREAATDSKPVAGEHGSAADRNYPAEHSPRAAIGANPRLAGALGLIPLSGDVGGHKLRICKPVAQHPELDLRKVRQAASVRALSSTIFKKSGGPA